MKMPIHLQCISVGSQRRGGIRTLANDIASSFEVTERLSTGPYVADMVVECL